MKYTCHSRYFYSNCLFEAIKGKLKDWKNVEVKKVRSRDNMIHFVWINRKEKTQYDFAQVQIIKHWFQYVRFYGYIRKKKIK